MLFFRVIVFYFLFFQFEGLQMFKMCLLSNKNSSLGNKNFEKLKYIILDATEDILSDNSCDLDSAFFNTELTRK